MKNAVSNSLHLLVVWTVFEHDESFFWQQILEANYW